MVNYTAIYSTESLKDIEYAFKAVDGNAAKRFCQQKFTTDEIIIRNDDNGETFPLIDEKITPTAYISRCMVSGVYHLYIQHKWDGKTLGFAPVIELTKEYVPETIINEYNECEARKSTHKLGDWYVGFPESEVGKGFVFKMFCEKYGELNFIEL